MRASPKSRIRACTPSGAFGVIMMFAGLMSRWMMFWSCACARPESTWHITSAARCGSKRRCSASTSNRSRPLTSCITTYGFRSDARESEIEDPRVHAERRLRRDHDVRRLNVAMDDVLLVRLREAGEHLAHHVGGALWIEAPLLGEHVEQIAPAHELHHDVRL